VANGPLIPGMREFDRPRSRRPAWLGWLIGASSAIVVLIVLAGFVGGVGPLRVLGLTSTALSPVAYRPTASPTAIQVAVTLPPSGLCRGDELTAVAFERSNRVEVETVLVRSRNGTCTVTTMGGDLRWIDVILDHPLGTRTVINSVDRAPLSRDPGSVS
jgi:hypothetical protein